MSNNNTFNLTRALVQRTSSQHTIRAYYRWIDQYMVDLAGMKPTRGDARYSRMSQLPLRHILPILQAETLETWLNLLADGGHSRQGIDQARASVVTLSEILEAEGLINYERLDDLKYVSAPSVAIKRGQNTVLSRDELTLLMNAARENTTSHTQMLRNNVAMMMLCLTALRREELSAAKWGDLQRQGDKIVLVVRQGGGAVHVPTKLLTALTRWRDAIGAPPSESPLIRRIWKGGRIAKAGLSSDGIWLIVKDAAKYANLGHVSPDDLRRSVAGRLRDTGHPIEDISKLLRHKNVTITERYLKRIPRQDDKG